MLRDQPRNFQALLATGYPIEMVRGIEETSIMVNVILGSVQTMDFALAFDVLLGFRDSTP
jgi:hypothetical protein